MTKNVVMAILMNVKRLSCCAFAVLAFVSFASAQHKTFKNSIGMEFILIQPGTMVAGRFQPPYPVPADTVKSADRPLIMWMGDGRPYNAEEFRLAKQLAERDAMKGFVVELKEPYYIGK